MSTYILLATFGGFMKKITDFLGKPVLSLYESVTQGIVKDLMFDKNFKKLKYLIMFDDNEFQEEKIVNVLDIYSYGENAIVVKNNACVELKSAIKSETSNPINNRAYTTLGKFVGIVTDVTIDDKYNIKSIQLDNESSIEINKVVTSGKDAMFVQDEENYVKLCNFKSKAIQNKQENKNIKVAIMHQDAGEKLANIEPLKTEAENISVEASQESTAQENENIEKSESISEVNIEPIKPRKKVELNSDCLPIKSATKNNFLIGRKVQRNIYSFNHELIIKKNTRVNEKTILIAKSHSKLKELTLYSA